MSIDDKMEKRYRELRLKERTNGINSSKNETSYVGFATGPEEYVYVTATQSEPMDFCPECNGMMLPYLDGQKCQSCGYSEGVSERVSEVKVEYTRIPEIKENSYRPKSVIIKDQFEDENKDPQELKDKLTNLDEDIFDIVVMLLGVPKSLEKEEKINRIIGHNKTVRIDNAIEHAHKIKL